MLPPEEEEILKMQVALAELTAKLSAVRYATRSTRRGGSGVALFIPMSSDRCHPRLTPNADRMRLPIHRGERNALAGELDVLHNTYRSVEVGLFTITRLPGGPHPSVVADLKMSTVARVISTMTP